MLEIKTFQKRSLIKILWDVREIDSATYMLKIQNLEIKNLINIFPLDLDNNYALIPFGDSEFWN